MRFAVAHKAATYLMVGFAYLAMIAGGAVAPMIALAGLVGLVGSWWWEPPNIRYERWTWVWTTASVFALVYSVLTAVVTGDFLGVGAQFLIWLVVAKAYNRRAARDWQQMYLLAFLMLVAGSVLNADLTYGVCFLGFVIAATWALTLFHLRREMEDNLLVKHAADRASERVEVRRILDSKRIVGGRFFVGTGLLSFGVFLIAALVFLAIPRVGFGFFLKNRAGLSLSGFSDGVKLGGHGVIKQDSTIVMRVEIDPKYGARDRTEIHWRGVAFDHYEKGAWTRSRLAPMSAPLRYIARAGIERHLLGWEGSGNPSEVINSGVKQDIWLEPLDSDVLFGASNPHVYELAAIARKRKPRPLFNDEFRIEHGSTLHYTVWSDLTPPSPAELRAARGSRPASFDVYLQLPTEITPETHALARRLTEGLPNNYDKVIAIERWLETNLGYTLEQRDPGRTEPVHYFLFDRKKGHCEYFASAFVVLARAAGVPTRQVNGFLGGEWNEYQGYVAVRAGDAHSWAEVFFPGKGWVTFDPTPASPGDGLGRGGTGWRAKLGRMIDTLRFQWSKWVIEYDLVAQLSLFKDIGRAFKAAARGVRDTMVAVLAYWPVVAAIAAAIAAFVMWRRRRSGPDMEHGRGPNRRRARSPIASTYDQVIKQLAKHGTRRDAGMTPRELADRVIQRGDPAAAELRELTELYYADLWGGRSDAAAEQRAGQLAITIRTALRDRPPGPEPTA
jgi:transglutaminase-like putative cysteine protease